MIKKNKETSKEYLLGIALNYAMEIIEAYELECRNLQEYLENHNPQGFCQGKIFKDALKQINKILE